MAVSNRHGRGFRHQTTKERKHDTAQEDPRIERRYQLLSTPVRHVFEPQCTSLQRAQAAERGDNFPGSLAEGSSSQRPGDQDPPRRRRGSRVVCCRGSRTGY